MRSAAKISGIHAREDVNQQVMVGCIQSFSHSAFYFPLAQDPGQKFPADVSLMRIGKS